MSTAKNPKSRASDVARWVAILAEPIPPHYGGAALQAIRVERRNATSMLSSWGLDAQGNPKAAPVQP